MMTPLFKVFISKVPERNIGTVFSVGFYSRSIQTKPSKQKINNYVLTKYVKFVESNANILEKRFPGAVKLYRVFSVGIKDFTSDVLLFLKIYKKVHSSGFQSLTRKEMEIYHQLPKDMIRVAPVLFTITLPLGGAIFPVAYMFPKKLLTYHFWSLQQRSEFALQDLKRKLVSYRPLFRCLQARLRAIKFNPLHKSMSSVLGSIGSGVHPSADEILICKPLFEKEPFGIRHMNYNHLGSLLRIHDMHKGWRRRKRLEERAKLIYYMDMAIIREGGVEKMTQDEIRWACFFRGLNPINMRNEDIAQWLNSWLRISRSINKDSYSLLLHCPILTTYNQPSNWALLRDTRT